MADTAIDIVIPTIPGREESLERCVTSFERLTDADLNCIIVRNSESCGQGWLEGLEESKAPFVALIADDLECVSETWAAVCVETVELGLLPCPRVYRSDGTIESQGGDLSAYGHLLARPTKDGTQVDFTVVPFCSREQIDAIGMIPTQYACDVWVSYRGRQLGWDTALVHGYDLVHYQEQVGRGAGMTQNERDALDTQKMYDELAHASHTQTLRAVMEELQPKRVLELGAGNYSTKTFLDFPIEELISVEPDTYWRLKVEEACSSDHRLKFLGLPPQPMDFDLVFIDNGTSELERLKAIQYVLSGPHPVTVIHDADNPAYRKAIEELTNGNVTYSEQTPQTAVIR